MTIFSRWYDGREKLKSGEREVGKTVFATPKEAAFIAFTRSSTPKERGELAKKWLANEPDTMKAYIAYGKQWAKSLAPNLTR